MRPLEYSRPVALMPNPPLVPLEIAYILKKAGADDSIMTPALELWFIKASKKYRSLDTIALKLSELLTKSQA